jgi:hypothetical protein
LRHLRDLRLLFGAQLQLIEASGEGYPTSRSQTDAAPGPWIGVLYQFPIKRWLTLVGQATASARFASYSFYATDPGSPRQVLYTLPSFEVGLAGGAAARF